MLVVVLEAMSITVGRAQFEAIGWLWFTERLPDSVAAISSFHHMPQPCCVVTQGANPLGSETPA